MQYCCVALSICLRLPMQALARDDSRAETKFGIAIASRMPMIRTTIMISTRVNPAFLLWGRKNFMRNSFFGNGTVGVSSGGGSAVVCWCGGLSR